MLFFSASASIRKGPCQFAENFPSVFLASLFILQTKSPGWNFLDLTLELYLRDMLCFATASCITALCLNSAIIVVGLLHKLLAKGPLLSALII